MAAAGKDQPPDPAQRSGRPPAKAGHGYRSEVNWDTEQGEGAGRQPYANQPEGAGVPPAGMPEVPGGDRGAHSGVNQEQMDQVRGTPP
jgi:hypothetical protein